MSIIFKSTKRRPGEQWQTNGRWYRREHGKTVRIPPPGQKSKIDLLRSRQDLDQARGGLLTNREYADATRELEDAWDKYVKSPVSADDTPLNLIGGPVIPTVDDSPIELTSSVVDKEIDELLNDDEPVELLSDTEPVNPVEVDEEPIDVSEIIADYEDVVNKQSEVKHEAAKSLAAEPQLEKKATELAREIRSSSLQRELDGKPGAWEGVEDAAHVWLGGFERLVERYGVIAGGTAASAALVGQLAGGVIGGALGVGAVASVMSNVWSVWMVPDAMALAGALTLGGAAVGGGLMAAPIIGAARAFESVTGVNLVRKNLEMATREELCLAGLEEAERCNREWIDLMRAKHG